MTDQQAAEGRYLFAVARGLDESSLVGVSGMRGAPLEVLEHRGLQAVVCQVDLTEFGEEPLKRNLEDLGWLEQVARCHNDVVFAAASAGVVAPMRLVTICSDDGSVQTRIDSVYEDLEEALTRVEGRHEWSVKVYAVPQETSEPAAPTRATSGAAYLQRKREQATKRRTASDQHVHTANEIHQTLAFTVAANRVLAPQDPRLTGRTDTMILNGAYLVPDEDAHGFQALVARLQELHPTLDFEVQGPWPPYSFATLD